MKILLITTLLSILFCSQSHARNTDNEIHELDKLIAMTTDPSKLSDLHVFKARNYQNAGNDKLAIKSYIQSLKQKQKGIVWAELGSMYFKTGAYENAFIVTAKVISQYPQLQEGATLLEKSKKEQERIFTEKYPQTIIVNSRFKGKRTRHDVIREIQERDAAIASSQSSQYLSNIQNSYPRPVTKKEKDRAYQTKSRELDDKYNEKIAAAGPGKRRAMLVRKHREERKKLYKDPVGYGKPKGSTNKTDYPHLSRADGKSDARSGRHQITQSGSYADGYKDEKERETNRNSTINGEWDTSGRHYTPAGGGNAWRSDGTFMQKAAGGYIDTKTGQFVPAN